MQLMFSHIICIRSKRLSPMIMQSYIQSQQYVFHNYSCNYILESDLSLECSCVEMYFGLDKSLHPLAIDLKSFFYFKWATISDLLTLKLPFASCTSTLLFKTRTFNNLLDQFFFVFDASMHRFLKISSQRFDHCCLQSSWFFDILTFQNLWRRDLYGAVICLNFYLLKWSFTFFRDFKLACSSNETIYLSSDYLPIPWILLILPLRSQDTMKLCNESDRVGYLKLNRRS